MAIDDGIPCDEGQQNLLRSFLEVQIVRCGRTTEEAATFVQGVVAEWVASDPKPSRSFDVDGYKFRIKICGPGEIQIGREL